MTSIGSDATGRKYETRGAEVLCGALILPEALLTADLPLAGVVDFLAEAELARFRTYRVAGRRNSLVASRIFLKTLLDRFFGEAAAAWRIESEPGGRPRLVTSDGSAACHLSLSHTHGLIGCALSFQGPLGCDVELLAEDRPQIASAHFAPDELAEYLELDGLGRRRRFYQLWTLKEAFLKADGRGLAVPLDRFRFDLGPGHPPAVSYPPGFLGTAPAAWRFRLHEPTADHQMAVAVCCGRPVVFRHETALLDDGDPADPASWIFRFLPGGGVDSSDPPPIVEPD